MVMLLRPLSVLDVQASAFSSKSRKTIFLSFEYVKFGDRAFLAFRLHDPSDEVKALFQSAKIDGIEFFPVEIGQFTENAP